MVFAYLRDAYNYYFGNRYPQLELVATLNEQGGKAPESTALVRYTTPDLKVKPILQIPRMPFVNEKWVETHPSKSVCVRQLHTRHEEF
jgi:hypothetical protein